MKISEILIKERKKRNMTQRALALKSGVSNATISRTESGEVTPDTSTLKKLSKALNVDIDYLLGQSKNDFEENTVSKNTVISIGRGGERVQYEISDEDAAIVNAFIEKMAKKN